jgi:hypothetical protein
MSTTALPPKSSRLRRWRWPLLGVAVLVAVPAVFVGRHFYRALDDGRFLRETLADLDRRDPHWRIEALEARRAVVPDGENSAPVIRAGRALIGRPDHQLATALQTALEDLAPQVGLTDAQWRAVVDVLEAVEPAVGQARGLVRFPRGRHPITYSRDGVGTLLRHADDISTLHQWVLTPLTLLHVHEGNSREAVRDLICLLHLRRSLGDEPFAVSQLWRAGQGEAVRGLERLLAQLTVADDDLALLQAKLAEEVDYDAWPTALRGERAMLHLMMTALGDGILKPAQIRRSLISGPKPSTPLAEFFAWLDDQFVPELALSHGWILQRFTRLIDETAALPWHERTDAVTAIWGDEADAPGLIREVYNNPRKWLAGLQSSQAAARTALVAVAAERYRLRHGAWPATLAALAPEFLPAVPADPFNGQPLRFTRFADGLLIYSVGSDLSDDGGAIKPIHPVRPMTDVGIRLWDPPHRRQPPPAIAAPEGRQ